MHLLQATASANPRQSFWRLYMAVWAVLAGASLAYLALFSQNLESQRRVIARIQTEFSRAGPASGADRTPAADAAPALTDKVHALNKELETLRRKLKQAKETPPVEAATVPDSGDAANTATAPPGAEQRPARSSSLTTASIPRAETPDVTEQPAASFNPFAANGSAVITDDARSGESGESVAETSPALSAVPHPEPETSNETAIPAVVNAPHHRDLKGQNLAIRPLRPGRVPPLPARQAGRSAATVLAPTTQPNRVSGTFAQPAVLNSDSPSSQTKLPVRPTVARSPAPQPTQTSFGTPTIKRAPPASALVLSSASSITGLRASWLLLTTRHGQTLASLQPRYVTDPATGTYRLLAGPVTSRSEADRLCSDLIGQGVRCGVTNYAGSPF